MQFDAHGGFSFRYNSYRFSLNSHASLAAADAFDRFQTLLNDAQPLAFVLQPDTVLLINNSQALHGRDVVQDNRRLLVRLFGSQNPSCFLTTRCWFVAKRQENAS